MKKYLIKFTDLSLDDVDGIFQYGIETFGEKAALNYLNELENAYEKLRKMPTIGHVRKDIPENTLCYNIEPNAIIYSINEIAKSLVILRILNSKNNFEEQF